MKNYNLEIMNELVKNNTLRQAVKWLDTSISKTGKTPAQLMKEGKSRKVLNLLKKK